VIAIKLGLDWRADWRLSLRGQEREWKGRIVRIVCMMEKRTKHLMAYA